MAVCVTRFTFGGGTENGGDIVVTFNVGFLGEIQIAAVGLRFTGKGCLEVIFGLRSL